MAVVAAVLADALATDLRAHARNRAEHAELTAARATLAEQRTVLAVTKYVTAVTTSHRDALRTSVASTLGQIASTQGTLHGADVLGFLQAVDIGTLHTCLGGVQQSLAADRDGQRQRCGAVHLRGGRTLQDHRRRVERRAGLSLRLSGSGRDPRRVDLLRLRHQLGGRQHPDHLLDRPHPLDGGGGRTAEPPAWATPDETWAPAVVQIGTTFVLYYAVRVAGPGGGGAECISVATATQPQGPYADTSTGPVECQPTLGGSIDPSVYVDPTGTPYLVWKSNGGGGASAIWSQQLDAAGTAFAPATQPVQLLVPDQSWEGGVIEAPDFVSVGGRYLPLLLGQPLEDGGLRGGRGDVHRTARAVHQGAGARSWPATPACRGPGASRCSRTRRGRCGSPSTPGCRGPSAIPTAGRSTSGACRPPVRCPTVAPGA